MGWNYICIPKLQRCSCWSLGMYKQFYLTLYWACDYLSMLGLKLNHVSKRGPRKHENIFIFSFLKINTLRLRQNGCLFADDLFESIFLSENVWNLIKISLKFVPKGPINNIPTLVQVMAWHWPGDNPLSGPMMVRLPMHICITQPQWVKMARVFEIFAYPIFGCWWPGDSRSQGINSQDVDLVVI